MANSVDPDETPHPAASHLGLYCLLRPVCPNIYGKYGKGFWCPNIWVITTVLSLENNTKHSGNDQNEMPSPVYRKKKINPHHAE